MTSLRINTTLQSYLVFIDGKGIIHACEPHNDTWTRRRAVSVIRELKYRGIFTGTDLIRKETGHD